MTIVYAVLTLGALGLIFGLILTYAGKKFYVHTDEKVAKVRECLAGANCGACGYAGCDAFAKAVVEGKAKLNGCAPAGEAAALKIAEIMGQEISLEEPKVARVLCQGMDGIAKPRYHYDGYQSCLVASQMAGGPKECRFSCIGLGDCMDHCAFQAISLKDGIAHINEERCTACGACVDVCPRHTIQLLPKSQIYFVHCQNSDVARAAREACTKACIGCGRCVKACQHDAIHVENGFARIDHQKCVRCGECAKVCPCGCIPME